ncbi:hypothetical protein BGZ94_005717 [Podila epigama]|nr:hypothetical protein BGZ94_005717 [Podila epigama]
MGFCHRCGDLVHGANLSVTSGLSSTGSRNDPWINAYQNILEGGIHKKPTKRMSMPASSPAPQAQQQPLLQQQQQQQQQPTPQPLVLQKHCHGCSKTIHQAKVFVEPGKPMFLYCEKCYTEKFTKGACPSCFKPVLSKTDSYITHAKRSWHTSCFVCFKCRVDVSTSPLVDLKGRPCCEDCLMAQAGDAGSPEQPTHTNVLTPQDRSLTNSPAPTLSPLTASRNHSSDMDDLSRAAYSRLAPASLHLNVDTGLARHIPDQQSPLSSQSASSHSSLSNSFRQTPSSGYTSGTSSTYSSLGRRRSNSFAPSATANGSTTSSTANGSYKGENGLSANRALLHEHQHQRPGSSLSVHSYVSSRPTSPGPGTQEASSIEPGSQNHSLQGSSIGFRDTDDPSSRGLRRSRSRSLVDVNSLDASRTLQPPVELSNSEYYYSSRSAHSSRPGTPGLVDSQLSIPEQQKSLHARPSTPDTGLVSSTASLSISTKLKEDTTRSTVPATANSITSHPPSSSRPVLTRVRSRSSVGPMTTGMVRARTEAWMNQSQASLTTPTTPKNGRHTFGSTVTLGSQQQRYHQEQQQHHSPPEKNNHDTKPLKMDGHTLPRLSTTGREDGPGASSLEAEPNRSSLHRHGRQRSSTVGEAVAFPAVKVDSLASPTMERASIPENHCHKCLEKVTENGIRLQNGDRFHIGCFLCYGCHHIFTESEFHIVLGRPYHPKCVSMAPSVASMTGVVTKCAQCHKVVSNKTIRFGGMMYHPQCFTCSHCHTVLQSTSRFFEVDGKVECEKCCEERDRERLAPKIVPVARRKDNFPAPPPTVPAMARGDVEAVGPGGLMVASSPVALRSGSGYGSPVLGSGHSSPQRSPGSPMFNYSATAAYGGLSPTDQSHQETLSPSLSTSPVILMASPLAPRSGAPVLTSLFSTRTRPLPKFGGATICPRCQQAVGVMEQVPGPRNEKWHKKCLNCKECKKVLDSSAMTRGEGEAFCRGCFNKTRVRA